MFEIRKDASFSERNIPLGVLEVSYPENGFVRDALHALIERELAALCDKYADYDRKAVFGENPYFRFFRKFKKTYPVMQQFETVMFKGRPFPEDVPVTALPFLLELTTFVLSGTHDIDRIDGPLTIFTPDAKLPFDGMRGAYLPERHLRPRRYRHHFQHDCGRGQPHLRPRGQPPRVLSGVRNAGYRTERHRNRPRNAFRLRPHRLPLRRRRTRDAVTS